jgi:hypothetical protein
MHALSTKLSKSNRHHIQSKEKLTGPSRPNAPMMKSLSRARDTCIAPWRQRASYYYDASWHTGKTFRQLVKSLANTQRTLSVNLGSCSNAELLVEQTNFF